MFLETLEARQVSGDLSTCLKLRPSFVTLRISKPILNNQLRMLPVHRDRAMVLGRHTPPFTDCADNVLEIRIFIKIKYRNMPTTMVV